MCASGLCPGGAQAGSVGEATTILFNVDPSSIGLARALSCARLPAVCTSGGVQVMVSREREIGTVHLCVAFIWRVHFALLPLLLCCCVLLCSIARTTTEIKPSRDH